MTSRNRLITQAKDIKRRAKQPPEGPPRRCTAMGCTRLTQRSSGRGLSETHCKQHREFHRRHGSYWRRSYLLKELAPYRAASLRWIAEHDSEPDLLRTIKELDWLIATSGEAGNAYSTRNRTPEGKAKAVFARLREANKTGRQLLVIALTIRAITSDIGPRGNPEFLQVQIAKMVHRLAPYVHRTESGFPLPAKYPRAEGIFLRIVGRRVEEAAAPATGREVILDVIAMVRAGRTA